MSRTKLYSQRPQATVADRNVSQEMKKPLLAFTLSFFLPGTGLAYLGKWQGAVLNLVVVLTIGFTLAVVLSEETFDHYIRFVAIVCAGGSGGLAQGLATQMNQKAKPNEEQG